MSGWTDSLGKVASEIAIDLAKEAYSWLKGKAQEKVRQKVGEAANAIDPAVLEGLVATELALIFRGWNGAEGFEAEIAAAEARGKAHPLGGGLNMLVCCSCDAPEMRLEGNGTLVCAKCGKPDFQTLKLIAEEP